MPAVTTAAYPEPRYKRTGGPSQASRAPDTSGATARTRVFPFIISSTGTGRNTFSFPSLRGPVILKEFTYSAEISADPPRDTLELGWATTPITELAAALDVPRPYNVLTELQDPQNLILLDVGQGFPNNTLQGGPATKIGALNIVIDAVEVYVCISSVTNGGGTGRKIGYLTLVENVSRDALSFFQ